MEEGRDGGRDVGPGLPLPASPFSSVSNRRGIPDTFTCQTSKNPYFTSALPTFPSFQVSSLVSTFAPCNGLSHTTPDSFSSNVARPPYPPHRSWFLPSSSESLPLVLSPVNSFPYLSESHLLRPASSEHPRHKDSPACLLCLQFPLLTSSTAQIINWLMFMDHPLPLHPPHPRPSRSVPPRAGRSLFGINNKDLLVFLSLAHPITAVPGTKAGAQLFMEWLTWNRRWAQWVLSSWEPSWIQRINLGIFRRQDSQVPPPIKCRPPLGLLVWGRTEKNIRFLSVGFLFLLLLCPKRVSLSCSFVLFFRGTSYFGNL